MATLIKTAGIFVLLCTFTIGSGNFVADLSSLYDFLATTQLVELCASLTDAKGVSYCFYDQYCSLTLNSTSTNGVRLSVQELKAILPVLDQGYTEDQRAYYNTSFSAFTAFCCSASCKCYPLTPTNYPTCRCSTTEFGFQSSGNCVATVPPSCGTSNTLLPCATAGYAGSGTTTSQIADAVGASLDAGAAASLSSAAAFHQIG